MIKLTQKASEGYSVIKVSGNFGFEQQLEFRRMYESVGQCGQVILDLSESSNINTSALGMILVMKHHLEVKGAQVSVVGAKEQVLKVLEVSGICRFLPIEGVVCRASC